jgi:hypothetical protein
MIISHTNKFIFFKPMKYAGSSLEYSLWKVCADIDLCTGGTPEEQQAGYHANNNEVIVEGKTRYRFHTHLWPDLFYEQTGQHRWHDYRKITAIRNPWDTVVSWYWWGMSNSANNNSSLCIERKDTRVEARAKFETYLNASLSHPSMELAGGFVQCTPLDYIASINERFVSDMDYYIQYETLKEDYINLCGHLDLETHELMKFKTSQRKLSEHYSYYYTAATRIAVEKKFGRVLQKFNYQFKEAFNE